MQSQRMLVLHGMLLFEVVLSGLKVPGFNLTSLQSKGLQGSPYPIQICTECLSGYGSTTATLGLALKGVKVLNELKM